MIKKIALLLCVVACRLATFAQVNNATDAVKDSIIARFNRDDYAGIYQLAGVQFSKNVSEARLTGFLKGNRDNGLILNSSLLSETNGARNYQLEFEARDMKLTLKLDSAGKFDDFGLANINTHLLEKSPATPNDNPLKTPTDRLVDSIVRDYFRNVNVSGVSIGFIKNGKAYQYNYGFANKRAARIPVPGTVYELASVTKTFTATLLAHALLEGKLSLTDDIRTYLPGSYPNLQYQGQPITILALANHTSRLPSLPPNIGGQPGAARRVPELNYTSALFYAALAKVKIDTLPGFKFEYSNWGMALLGQILENVYHQPYETLLHKYISGPLGMTDTHCVWPAKYKNQVAVPYSENGRPAPYQPHSLFTGAGGVLSNIDDMLKYLRAQISETDNAIKLTHQPTKNGMGLAWGARNEGSYRNIQHNGSSYGFTTNITVFPELQSGCVILTNSKIGMGKLIVAIQAVLKQKDI